jgi:hypothetical protein
MHDEHNKILHHSQKGFSPVRNMVGQPQAIIAALEDTKFTNKVIYITHINFKNCI